MGGLPVTAAVQRACIASEPVVSHPPSIRDVGIAAMAVSALITFISISLVAVLKVAIVVVRIRPAWLVHDAAEPALATAIHRAINVGRLCSFRLACRLERARAASVSRRQYGLRGRAVVVMLVWKMFGVICPERARIIAALLAGSFGTRAPPVDAGR